jgi:glycosyltransferase involved in cell wall biosynthesis
MYRGKRVSVIIPCHDEEEGVRAVIERMPSLVDEILVVDNASNDRTAEVARELGARVVHEARKGYGLAYQTGFQAASGDIIVTMDGDGTYPPDAIQLLLHVFLDERVDFMTARRWRPLSGRKTFTLRVLGNAILSGVALALFRRFIWDSQSGMWVFWAEHLSRLQPRSDGMALSQEIKILAFTDPDLRCLEMPIFYGDHRIGESKLNMWRDGFGNLLHLFKMRLTLRRRRSVAMAPPPVASAVP